MIMAKEKVNYQEMYDLYRLCGETKVMLEAKKPKSWLKSVSAFANGLGGSLLIH